MAFWHVEFCEAEGNEGMGSAEQRYCILEARVLSHNEDQRKQTEEMHAMATGAVFCWDKERRLKPRILICFHHVIPGPAVPLTHCMSLAELRNPLCPILLAHIGLSSGRNCARRHGLNQLRSLHSSLSLSLLLRC